MPPSSRTPPRSTSGRSPGPWRWTPTCRPSSRSSSAPPTRRSGRASRRRCPRATCSPGSSSASCASAARRPASADRPPPPLLRRRTGVAVVARRAGGPRRGRLEALRADAVGDLKDGVRDPVAVLVRAVDGDLLVVEHVVVRLMRRLQLPRLARSDRIQRELHVLAQLGGRLGTSRLVVDELVAAVRQAVHSVHPPAQQMRAEAEGERPLEPHGPAVLVL